MTRTKSLLFPLIQVLEQESRYDMTKLSIETEISIRRLVDQYCDGVIRRDANIWGATWSTDAHWNLGMGREVHGKKAIVDLWTTAMGAFNWTIQTAEHFSLNIDEVQGIGTGHVVVRERYERTDGEKGDLLAKYLDQYVKIDGEWLFSERILEIIERN